MEEKDVKSLIEESVSILLKRDKYLLENDVNERSITHKLGMYIECIINKKYSDHFHVDCEYNRNGDESKRLEIKPYKKWLVSKKYKEHKYEAKDEPLVYPDIIVHKRKEEENLICIEVKKTTNKVLHGEEYDKEKLKVFTMQDSEYKYKYKFGVFIKFIYEKNDNVDVYKNEEVTYYKDGRKKSY